MVACTQKSAFTLIEVLVALLLSTLLIIGVVSIFITTQRGIEIQDQLVVMEQNNRAALEILARDIKMAGMGVDYGAHQPGFIDCAPYQLTINGDLYAEDASFDAEQKNPAAIIDNKLGTDGILPFDVVALSPSDTNNDGIAPSGRVKRTGNQLDYSANPADAQSIQTAPEYRAETIRYTFDRNNDYLVNSSDADPSYNPFDFALMRVINNGLLIEPVAFGIRGVNTNFAVSTPDLINGGRYPNDSFPEPLFQYWVDHDFNPATDPVLWGEVKYPSTCSGTDDCCSRASIGMPDGKLTLDKNGELQRLLELRSGGAVVFDCAGNRDNNEDENFNGQLDTGEDVNGNGVLDTNLLDLHLKNIVVNVTTTARSQDPTYTLNERSKTACSSSRDAYDPNRGGQVPNCYRFRERTFRSVIKPRNTDYHPRSDCGERPEIASNVKAEIRLCDPKAHLGTTPEESSVPVYVTFTGSADDGLAEDDILGYNIFRSLDEKPDNTPTGVDRGDGDGVPDNKQWSKIGFVSSTAQAGGPTPMYTYEDYISKKEEKWVCPYDTRIIRDTPGMCPDGSTKLVYSSDTGIGRRYVYMVTAVDRCNQQSLVSNTTNAQVVTYVPLPAAPSSMAPEYSVVAYDIPGDLSFGANQGVEVEWKAAGLVGSSIFDDNDGQAGYQIPNDKVRMQQLEVDVIGYNIYRLSASRACDRNDLAKEFKILTNQPMVLQESGIVSTNTQPNYLYKDSNPTPNTNFRYAVTTYAQIRQVGSSGTAVLCESEPACPLCATQARNDTDLSPSTFYDVENLENSSINNGVNGEARVLVNFLGSANERDDNVNSAIPPIRDWNPCPDGNPSACQSKLDGYFIYRRLDGQDFPRYTPGGELIPLYFIPYTPAVFSWSRVTNTFEDTEANRLTQGNATVYPALELDQMYWYTTAAAKLDSTNFVSGKFTFQQNQITAVYPNQTANVERCELPVNLSVGCDCSMAFNLETNYSRCNPERKTGRVEITFSVYNPRKDQRFELLRSESPYGNYIFVDQVSFTADEYGIISRTLYDLPTLDTLTGKEKVPNGQESKTDENYFQDTVDDAGKENQKAVTFYYRVRCVNSAQTPECMGNYTTPTNIQIAVPPAPTDLSAGFISNSCLNGGTPDIHVSWKPPDDCIDSTDQFIYKYEVERKNLTDNGDWLLIGRICGATKAGYDEIINPHYNPINQTFHYFDPVDNNDAGNNGFCSADWPAGASFGSIPPPEASKSYAYRVRAIARETPYNQGQQLVFYSGYADTLGQPLAPINCGCTDSPVFYDNFSDRHSTISNIPCNWDGYPDQPASCINSDIHTSSFHSYPWKTGLQSQYPTTDDETVWVYGMDTKRGEKSALQPAECSGCYGSVNPQEDSYWMKALRNNPNHKDFKLTFPSGDSMNSIVTLSNDYPPPTTGNTGDPGIGATNQNPELSNLQNYVLTASLRVNIDHFSLGPVFRYVDIPGIRQDPPDPTDNNQQYKNQFYGVAAMFNNKPGTGKVCANNFDCGTNEVCYNNGDIKQCYAKCNIDSDCATSNWGIYKCLLSGSDNLCRADTGMYLVVYKSLHYYTKKNFRRIILGVYKTQTTLTDWAPRLYDSSKFFGWITLKVEVCNTVNTLDETSCYPKIRLSYAWGKNSPAFQSAVLVSPYTTSANNFCKALKLPSGSGSEFLCMASGAGFDVNNGIVTDLGVGSNNGYSYCIGKVGFMEGPMESVDILNVPDRAFVDDVSLSPICNSCPF